MPVSRAAGDVATNPFVAKVGDTPLFGPGRGRCRIEARGGGSLAGRGALIAGCAGSGGYIIDFLTTTLVFSIASFIDFFITENFGARRKGVFETAGFIDFFLAGALGDGRVAAFRIERLAFIGLIDLR